MRVFKWMARAAFGCALFATTSISAQSDKAFKEDPKVEQFIKLHHLAKGHALGGDYAAAEAALKPLLDEKFVPAFQAMAQLHISAGRDNPEIQCQAVKWTTRAARLGDMKSTEEIADHFSNGWCIKQDRETSYLWARLGQKLYPDPYAEPDLFITNVLVDAYRKDFPIKAVWLEMRLLAKSLASMPEPSIFLTWATKK